MHSFINSSSSDEDDSEVPVVASKQHPHRLEAGKLGELLSTKDPVYSYFSNNTDLQHSNFLYESDDENDFDNSNFTNVNEEKKIRTKSKLTVADLLKKDDDDESNTYEHIINSNAHSNNEENDRKYGSKLNYDDNYWMEDSKFLGKITNENILPKYKYDSPVIKKATTTNRICKIQKTPSFDEVSNDDEDSKKPNINIPAINKEVKIELHGNESGEVTIAIPAIAARYLKPYQVVGVKWLWSKYCSRQGCILADDMGLGKTIQIISFLLAIYHKSGIESVDLKANRLKRKLGISENEIAFDNSSDSCHTPNVTSPRDIASISKITLPCHKDSPIHPNTPINNEDSISQTLLSNNLPVTPTASSSAPPLSSHPTLIITPKSLLGNWESELKCWGYFLIHVITSKSQTVQSGSTNVTRGTIDEIVKVAKTNRTEIILCTYNTMIQNISQLRGIRWELVIFDEGHLMKSPKSQVHLAALQLSSAKCRCILSGTPIQNKIEELWSLLNVVTNGNIDSKSYFISHYALPIKRAKSSKASEEDIALGKSRQKDLRKKVWQKYVLQRFKEDVLSDVLQGKDDIIVFCELSPIQLRLYAHVLSLPDFDNARFMRSPCPCGSQVARSECCTKSFKIPLLRHDSSLGGDGEEGESEIDPRAVVWRQMHPSNQACDKCPSCVVLPCINKLLKIASHPSLIQVNDVSGTTAIATAAAAAGGGVAQSNSNELPALQFFKEALSPDLKTALGGPKKSSEFLETSRVDVSGKLKTLEKLLVSFTSKNEKTLLFSQSTQTLDIIESYVRSRGWRAVRLDGSTAQTARQSLVNQFNNDSNILVFLISTRAGGLGLNLVSARKVIIFDCSWNPSMDMQAQDRSYRFGQLRHVSVYRLVAQGTVEELCYMRQLYKQALQQSVHATTSIRTEHNFEGVEGDKSCRGELFGIENLLQLETGGSILNKLRQKYRIEMVSPEVEADGPSATPSARGAVKSSQKELATINAINRMDAANLMSAAANEVKSRSYENTVTDDDANANANVEGGEEEEAEDTVWNALTNVTKSHTVRRRQDSSSSSSINNSTSIINNNSSSSSRSHCLASSALSPEPAVRQAVVALNNNEEVTASAIIDSVRESERGPVGVPARQPPPHPLRGNVGGSITSATTGPSTAQVTRKRRTRSIFGTRSDSTGEEVQSTPPGSGDSSITESPSSSNITAADGVPRVYLRGKPLDQPLHHPDNSLNSHQRPPISSKKRKLPSTLQISGNKSIKQVEPSNKTLLSRNLYNPNYA